MHFVICASRRAKNMRQCAFFFRSQSLCNSQKTTGGVGTRNHGESLCGGIPCWPGDGEGRRCAVLEEA